MITAGYFVGQILDDLAGIGTQVSNRNTVGLNDLSKFLENFYRDILNDVCGYNLTNCNENRSNAPGLDLADAAAGIGIQITSQSGSGKINDTLKTLTDAQIADHPTIIVFIAGNKQKSYPGLDHQLCERAGFTAENIWDFTDICKKLINVPLDSLQSLHKKVSAQVARVKIELEVPNKEGVYQTGIEAFAEEIPQERISDLR